MTGLALEVEDLVMHFGPVRAVDGVTLRIRQGAVRVVDGPFAETKELLAGFYLLDAKDMDEALAMAAKIPPAREGSIEVRPVRELNPGT